MVRLTKTAIRVHIRWMIRRDFKEVLQIEQDEFVYPWSSVQFIRCLRQRNCIGQVAEFEDHVIAYMIYELHKTRIHLLNFAVSTPFQMRGVGRQMIDKLYAKLTTRGRQRIVCEIREKNIDAQLFFRAMGFKAVAVLTDFYEDSTEDAYLFQRRYKAGG